MKMMMVMMRMVSMVRMVHLNSGRQTSIHPGRMFDGDLLLSFGDYYQRLHDHDPEDRARVHVDEEQVEDDFHIAATSRTLRQL